MAEEISRRMKGRLVILSKSPKPDLGRFGSPEKQDWMVTCRAAVNILVAEYREWPEGAKIVVPSAFQPANHQPETQIYADALIRDLSLSAHYLTLVPEGFETIGQVDYGLSLADGDTDVIFICTLLHLPRVWWLTRKADVYRVAVWGLPRWREAITDIALAIAFPVIDLLGYRKQFQAWTIARRLGGAL